jgi:hypothetical protein
VLGDGLQARLYRLTGSWFTPDTGHNDAIDISNAQDIASMAAIKQGRMSRATGQGADQARCCDEGAGVAGFV